MSTNRANTSQNQILEVPFCVSIIRVFQFVLAIILLALSAYGVSKHAYDCFGPTLFTALATLIITVYILIASEFYVLAYNYWTILSLDIFLVIFWLISFSLAAANGASYWNITHEFCYNDIYCGYNSIYLDVLKTTVVFGAIELIMFIATLAVNGVYMHRLRN